MTTYDATIIGVGSMGSAAAYQLARRGKRVLALEQFDVPHALGSYHGVNRIIRLAYAEHPDYVPLLRRAYARWREIEKTAGEPLLIITGGLDVGPYHGATVKGSLLSCQTHGLTHELLDAAHVARRFPGYRLPDDLVAVYQPDGGFLMSERCVVAYAAAALDAGAEIHAREPVRHWDADGDTVRIETERAMYRARSLVITAGAWTSRLLPALKAAAVPERQVLLWTDPRRRPLFQPPNFPVFNLDAPEGHFYGFPVYGVPGFKIGLYHHRRERVDPDTIDRECHPEDEAVIRQGVRSYFPDADGPTLAMRTCMFTNSPDEHFIIDRHPRWPNVAFAGGFSGHGFKFASVVGEILAELVVDGRSRHDIGLFRLDRPVVRDAR